MEKDEILNSYCDVRSSAAGNPNTPVDTLIELSKDSHCDVRKNAAGNPNTPGYTSSNEEFIITETYVAINGTNTIVPMLLHFIHVVASVVPANS